MVFPRGRLVTSWLDGAEQGSADFSDGVFRYRSGVDLAAGASVPLRFHVEGTGTTRPASCAVFRKMAALLRRGLQAIAECFGKS